MVKAGHGHLLPELKDYAMDDGLEVDDIDTPPMSPSRRVIIKVAQRMQPEPQGPTVKELLSPTRVKSIPPRHSTMALPVKPSPIPLGLAQQLSGRQMDASRNMRAQSKRTSFPAPLDPNKWAKTPTREHDELTRQSRSMHRHRSRGG